MKMTKNQKNIGLAAGAAVLAYFIWTKWLKKWWLERDLRAETKESILGDIKDAVKNKDGIKVGVLMVWLKQNHPTFFSQNSNSLNTLIATLPEKEQLQVDEAYKQSGQ